MHHFDCRTVQSDGSKCSTQLRTAENPLSPSTLDLPALFSQFSTSTSTSGGRQSESAQCHRGNDTPGLPVCMSVTPHGFSPGGALNVLPTAFHSSKLQLHDEKNHAIWQFLISTKNISCTLQAEHLLVLFQQTNSNENARLRKAPRKYPALPDSNSVRDSD